MLLDVVLIVLAYWSAYAIKFEPFSDSPAWKLFLRTLPVVVVVRLAAFLVFGVYRGIWRYTSMDDLMVFAKAVAAGSIVSMMIVLFKFRFEGFSRAVFVIDALVMLMLLAGSRMAFRLFRQGDSRRSARANGRRVLIYGAGDAGELLLRELLNNRELRCAPVGFMDDDPEQAWQGDSGLRVFGGNGCLTRSSANTDRADSDFEPAHLGRTHRRNLRECEAQNIELKRMSIRIESYF